jgi:hypothetical protein
LPAEMRIPQNRRAMRPPDPYFMPGTLSSGR